MDPFELIAYAIYTFIGLPSVLWVFWAWRTYKKKKKGLLTFQLIIFLGTVFWLTWTVKIFPGSQAYYDRQYIEQLTGRAFWTDLIYVYESPRAFNGDGYSIWVYDFDDKVAKHFSPPNKNFFSDYPIKLNYRSHWRQKKWDKAPLKMGEQKFLNFVLIESIPNDPDEAKKLQDTFNYIEKIINEQGYYYAFNYNMYGNNQISDVDFFIFLPTDRKLIVMNHNT